MGRYKFLTSLVVFSLLVTNLIGQDTFTKKGNKILIPYMAGFEVEVNGNKAKQETVDKVDFSLLKAEKTGKTSVSSSLKIPDNFKINNDFFTALDKRNSKNTSALPLDLTPILDTFLLKYDPTVNGFPKDSRLILTSLEFSADLKTATGHLILAVPRTKTKNKNTQKNDVAGWILLANSNVKFTPTAVGFKSLKLFLTKSGKSNFKTFPFDYVKKIEQDPSTGSYAQITCDGFEKFNIQATYTFDPAKMAPKWTHAEITGTQAKGKKTKKGMDTLNRSLKARFIIGGKNIRYFQDAKVVELNDKITFKDTLAPAMVFNEENFVIDFEESYVHTKAKLIQNSAESTAIPFTGMEFRKLGFSLVGFRRGKGTARKMMRVPAKDFGYTNAGGLTGYVKKVNFLAKNQETLSGWNYSIDTLEFKFKGNTTDTDLTMVGDILLPICQDTFFRYRGSVSFGDGTAKYNFVPIADFKAARGSQGTKFPIEFLRATMELATPGQDGTNSTIGLEWFGDGNNWYAGEFEPNAQLNGVLDFNWTVEEWKKKNWSGIKTKFKFPRLGFQNLKINDSGVGSTNDCAAADAGGLRNMSIEAFKFGGLSGAAVGSGNDDLRPDIADFPIQVSDINFRCLKDGKDVYYKFDLEVKVNILGKDDDDSSKKETEVKNDKKGNLDSANPIAAKSGAKAGGASGKAGKKGLPSKTKKVSNWSKFSAAMNKGAFKNTKSAELSGIAQFVIWAKVEDKNGKGFKGLSFDSNRWPVEALYVEGAVSNVAMKGGFVAFNGLENQRYGNGFKGFLNIEVELGKGGAKIGGALLAQYGTTKAIKITDPNTGGVQWQEGKKEYRYGFIDGEIVYARGVHVAKGLFFHGGGFTIGFNMERSSLSDDIQMEQTQGDQLRNEAVKISDPPPMISQDEGAILEPGVSLTGVKYAPRKDFYSVAIKGVFSWGKLPKASPGGAAAMLAAKGISSTKKPLVAPVVAFDLTVGVDLEDTPTGIGLSKIFFEGNTYVMPEGVTYSDRNDNAGTVKLQLEYNHIAHQFSGQLDVALEFPKDPKGPTTSISGTALIYFEIPYPGKSGTNKWFVKAGRPPHLGQGIEVGYSLGDLQLGQFMGYVQAGWDLDGIPLIKDVIPEWTNDEVMNPRVVGEDQMRNGNGVAMGASLKVPDKTYDFLMFRAQFYAGLGLDLSLQQYPANRVANLNCGKNGTFGVNNWYARGQAYAYMRGKLDMHVDVLVYEGWVNLFDLYLAAVMRAEMPNPEWFLARIKGRFSALGGLVEGTVNFKAEIGKRCSNLMGNPTANINMIQEVLPEDGAKDVPTFTSPIVTFTMPIEKVLELEVDNADGTTTKRVFKAELITFKVNGASGKVTIAKDFRSAVLQFDDLLAPNRDYSYEAAVGWKELIGSSWKVFTHAGKQATEKVTGKFKTGDRPDKILAGALEYQAPGYRQRYWHKGYAKAQLVFKNSGWEYLFPKNSNDLISYLGSSTGNSQLEKERKEDYKKKDAIPKDVPFEYIIRLSYQHRGKTITKEFDLDEFPGKVTSVQQPIINYEGGKNLSYQLPYVESRSVGGKAVIFDKINDSSFKLEKEKVYKLEIIRRPAAAYLSVARTAVTQKDTSFTDKVLVKSSKSTTGQTKAEQYEFGATINKKISKIDKSKTGADNVLYKILYEFHFGTSRYQTLAHKLNSYSSASSIKGEPKDKYDHPEETRIPIWKTIKGHRDRYFPIFGGLEPLDSYDEIKMLKNLRVTKPFVKRPWKYNSTKAENNAIVEGQHPWEADLYINEPRPMGRHQGHMVTKLMLTDYKNSSVKWTGYSLDFGKSIPRSIYDCSTKKADLRTSLHLDAFSLFSNHIFRPYYEKRTSGGKFETDIQHWAFRIRFNKGARKQLTDNEIKNGLIEQYTLNGKIDGLPSTQSYKFAFEDGRERVLKSQFELANTLAKIMLFAKLKLGDKNVALNLTCLKNEGLKSANYYASRYGVDVFDDPLRKNSSKYSFGNKYVEWEFPKIPIWDRFDQQVSQSIRDRSPNIMYRLGVGGSNTTKSDAEKAENERWVKKIYRNGELIASSGNLKSAIPYTGTGHIQLGGFSGQNGVSFTGYLDEVRIWTVARSRSEIKNLFLRTLYVWPEEIAKHKDKGLVVYLPFEDGNNKKSAKNLVDGKTVSFFNNKKPVRSRIGMFTKGGVYLDGANWGYIQNINLVETPFTLEAWVKEQKGQKGKIAYIFGQGQWGENNKGLHVGYTSSNKYIFGLYGDDIQTDYSSSRPRWRHWAVVMEKTKTKTSESNPSKAKPDKIAKPAKKPSELAVKHDGTYLELYYPEHLNKIEGMSIYNKTKQRIEFYWDGQKEESHKWVFDDKGKVKSFEASYKSNPKITYNDIDRDLQQPGNMFDLKSEYQATFIVDGEARLATVNNGEKKQLYGGGNLRTNTHLRLLHNLKTRKTSLKIEGMQPDYIEALSIYDDKGERLLLVEQRYISSYQNGVKVDRINSNNRKDIIELDPKKNYTLYLQSSKKHKVKYEIRAGGDYWTHSKAIIPVYTMNHQFDDCYLMSPPIAQNIALNLKERDFIDLKGGTTQVANFKGKINTAKTSNAIDFNKKTFSIEFWLQRSRNGKTESILQKGGSNGLSMAFQSDDKLKVTFNGNDLVTDETIKDQNWHHYILTYNKEQKTRKIYLDGVLLKQDVISNDLNVDAKSVVTIGRGFEGQIDEFRIWGKDIATIKYLTNPQFKIKNTEPALMTHLPLNGKYGKALENKGSVSLNVEMSGNPYCSWVVANSQSTNNNIKNPALQLTTGQFQVPNIVFKREFTIDFWAKGPKGKSGQCIFDSDEYLLLKYRDELQFTINKGKTRVDFEKNSFIEDNQWHHYTIIGEKGTEVSLYIDGVLKKVKKKSYTFSNSPKTLSIGGGRDGKSYFAGSIDNFRLWNMSCTSSQVGKLMERSNIQMPKCTDLLQAHFDFSSLNAAKGNKATFVGSGNWQKVENLALNSDLDSLSCLKEVIGNTLVFNQKNDFLDLGKVNLSSSFSIEFVTKWIASPIGNNWTILEGKGKNGFKITLENGYLKIGNLKPYCNYLDTDWHYWTIVFDDKQAKWSIYRDGARLHTPQQLANQKIKIDELVIGKTSAFEGMMAELKVWEIALDSAMIDRGVAQFGSLSNSKFLIREYSFKEGKNKKMLTDIANGKNAIASGLNWSKTIPTVKLSTNDCYPVQITNGSRYASKVEIEGFVIVNKETGKTHRFYDNKESYSWEYLTSQKQYKVQSCRALFDGSNHSENTFAFNPGIAHELMIKSGGKYFVHQLTKNNQGLLLENGTTTKPALWRNNPILKLDFNPSTSKIALSMEGYQAKKPKVISIYNEKRERIFFIENGETIFYKDGLPFKAQKGDFTNDIIELKKDEKYRIFIKNEIGQKLSYELGTEFWKVNKGRIPLDKWQKDEVYIEDGASWLDDFKPKTGNYKIDDCFFTKPFPFKEGQQFALKLRGNQDHLVISGNEKTGVSPIKLDNTSFTIDILLKRATTNKDAWVIRQGAGGKYQNLHIAFLANNKMSFGFDGDDLVTIQPYTDNDWHHWVFTFDKKTKTRRIFRDGQLVIQDIAKGDLKSKGDFIIGKGFDGQIGSLSVWRKALDYQELPILSNKTGKEDGLKLFLDFAYSKQRTNLFANKGPLNSSIKFNGHIDCVLNVASYKNNIQALAQNTIFSAKDGYIQFQGNSPKNNSMTIEFLAKGGGGKGKGKQVILSKQGGWEIALGAENTFTVANEKSKFSTPKNTFAADNQWHHYTFVFKEGKERNVYIDGKNIKVDKQVFTIKQGTQPVFLGKPANGQAKFNGLIDELRIWNEVISDQSISDYVFRIVSTDCPDLMHVYNNFEHTNLNSKIGSAGKYIGQGNWAKKEFLPMKSSTYTPCSKIFTCETGICDLKLNGGGTYVKSTKGIDLKAIDVDGSQFGLKLKPFTIEFKAKRKNIGKEEYLISHGEKGQSRRHEKYTVSYQAYYELYKGFEIGYAQDGRLFIALGDNRYFSNGSYNDTGWKHWACVFNKENGKVGIYLNGRFVEDISFKTQPHDGAYGRGYFDAYYGVGNLLLGTDLDKKSFFGGQLDDVRVWKVARKAKDIKLCANKFIPASCPDLLVYYDFNNGKIKDLVDKTGNNKAEFVNFQGGAGFNSSKVVQEEGISTCRDDRKWVFVKDYLFLKDYASANNGKILHRAMKNHRDLYKADFQIFKIEFMFKPDGNNSNDILSWNGSKINDGNKTKLEITYRSGNIQIYDGDKYHNFKAKKGWGKYVIDFRNHYYGGRRSSIFSIDNGQKEYFESNNLKGIPEQMRIGSRNSSQKGLLLDVKLYAYDEMIGHFPLNEGLGSDFTMDLKNNKKYKAHPENSWIPKKDIATIKGPKIKGYFALDFDGVDDELTGAGTVDLVNKSFTIEFWAKRKELNRSDLVVSQGKMENHKGLHIGFEKDNTFTVDFYGDGVNTPVYNDTDWHHWAIVYDKLGKRQTIYRDGIKVADKIVAQHYQGAGELLLVKDIFKGRFKGQLEEIRIWDTYRQSELIIANMKKQLTGKEPGLLRLYKLDILNSQIVKDETGKGSNLTLKNGNSNKELEFFNRSNIILPKLPVASKKSPSSNIGLDFDGIDDHLNLGKVDLANKSFSIEFWAKSNQNNRNNFVIGQGINSARKGLSIGFTKDNKFQFGFFGDELRSPVYSDKDWHHWAVTYDISNKKKVVYRDGKKVAENTASGHYDGVGDLYVGLAACINGEKYFNGTLDELRIWSKTRSVSEIAADWKSTIKNKPKGLLYNTTFNEGTGSKVTKNLILAKGEILLVNMNEKTDWHIVPIQLKPKSEMNISGNFAYTGKVPLKWAVSSASSISFWAKGPIDFSIGKHKKWCSITPYIIMVSGLTKYIKTDNKWHHWSFYKSGRNLEIYKDGNSIVKEKVYNGSISSSGDLVFESSSGLDDIMVWTSRYTNKTDVLNDMKGLTSQRHSFTKLRVFVKFNDLESMKKGALKNYATYKYNPYFPIYDLKYNPGAIIKR